MTPTIEQCIAALDRAMGNLKVAPLSETERAIYLANMGQLADTAAKRGVTLTALIAEFRFELAKATGNVAIPTGMSGSAPGPETLQ